MELSALCMSPCSSLVLGAESTTEGIRVQSIARDLNPVYQNRGGSKHHIKTDAIVSAEDVPLSSEFEETNLKIACDIESRSLSLSNKGSGELVKKLSNFEETHAAETNKMQPKQDGENYIVHNSRLYFEHGERDSSETSSTPVQESCTAVSPKGVYREHDDKLLHAPLQESYSLAISKGGPS